jgi:hypothetical protein
MAKETGLDTGHQTSQMPAHEWVSFPGGELEGQRPRALCPACREALKAAAIRPVDRRPSGGTLCFQCYRANLERERALREAGTINTASDARFQEQLPFEPINEGRLAMLKVERTTTRGAVLHGLEKFADRRRRAQMAARHALQSILAVRPARTSASGVYDRSIAAAIHAAELQLPESWLPFVIAR